ncbi:MAG TPA: hypothetical protein VHE55_02180 [Fimbriimonadaceae bacterium]|nr:hypothetical protein [Fimbriimonadaceae bacterium]
MMLCLLVGLAIRQEAPERTEAIYRMPASEASSPRFRELLDDEFDTLCVDPAPNASIRATVGKKLAFIEAKLLDTAANRKWRDATIDFANGKISPKAWVARTSKLHETVHWLSNPNTPNLREATPSQTADPTYSGRSVFAEMLLLAWPGRPCLTSTDCWLTRDLPDAGRLQSWVLAMNDWRGPMLSFRHDRPEMAHGPIQVLRADGKPGLLIVHLGKKGKGMTLYFNNSQHSVDGGKIDPEKVLPMGNGLDMDAAKPSVRSLGMVILPD